MEAGHPRDEVAARFEVSVPTVERWVRLKRETGRLARRPVPGPGVVKTAGLQAALPERLVTHADVTLSEQCSWWRDVSVFEVCTATMSRALTGLGWKRNRGR